MSAPREHFGSKTAFIMAMAGSAIGLGNIWRFPYIVGQNGGAAFILLYIFFCLFLSLPIMLSEAMIGRSSQANAFGAFRILAPGTRWKWLSLITVISPLIILSYYSVVGGWSLEYLMVSVCRGFKGEVAGIFGNRIYMHSLFLLICAFVVSCGVKSGIEKFNKVSLPILFVLIIVVMVYSLSMPGSSEGVSYLIKPDFSKLTGSSVACAMGQSFFSLSLGVGTILTYSSYVGKKDNLLSSSFGTALFDLVFALISGFAVMPAVFAAGIEPGSGPGLIFETLPYIFSSMGQSLPLLSRVVSILFFVTIVIAALTSAISMLEVGVAYLVEEKGMSRKKAVILITAGTWMLGALCSLSDSVFNFCDKLTSNFLIAFGSLLFVIFVGWKMKKSVVRDEFTSGGSHGFNAKVFGLLYFIIRYLAPLAIILIFFTNFLV